jgi:hypothetical protein
MLGLEGNWEWVVELVLGHGSESDVFRVWEVLQWGTVEASKQLGDLSYTVGSVVEEENLIAL